MHKFEFKPDDLFVNRLKTYPEYNIFIYQGQMSVNRGSRITGSGGIEVYDTNRNRIGSEMIYPFVDKSSQKNVFKNQKFQPLVQNYSGDRFWISKYATESGSATVAGHYAEAAVFIDGAYVFTSSYSQESPIKRNLASTHVSFTTEYYDLDRSMVQTATQTFTTPVNLSASALQNVARKYTTLSDHFIFTSSSVRSRDLVYDPYPINFITIPSMYYGSTIKKGSVELNYYITGSKIAACADIHNNGTLIETTGSSTGSVVGLVLYDEGILMLTASHILESNGIEYVPSVSVDGSWKTFGTTLNDGTGSSNTLASASYGLNFQGTNYINSMTMFAHARKGHLNHSNNPTYRASTKIGAEVTGSGDSFVESSYAINNIVSASYASASFDKVTYISKVHIYDEDGNLIAITSLAKPVKKTLEDEYTFKMKIDL